MTTQPPYIKWLLPKSIPNQKYYYQEVVTPFASYLVISDRGTNKLISYYFTIEILIPFNKSPTFSSKHITNTNINFT